MDDLKKQCQSLAQRIQQTQQNLAIQSKYRDAAVSMAKLYTPSDKKDGKRHSSMLHRKTDSVREADIERMRSEERCEELAAELFSLEKRIMEPQNRLLKHTAGILQMTHKGPKKMPKGQGLQQGGGVPGSPESMYTYHNARNSMEPLGEDIFDDRHLYLDADRLEGFGEVAREESAGFGPPLNVLPKGLSKEQLQMIAKTEHKLAYLNSRLRQVILKSNPERDGSIPVPAPVSDATQEPAEYKDILQTHLEYLESSIAAIDLDQSRLIKARGESDTDIAELSARLDESYKKLGEMDQKQLESDAAMEETIEDMNREIRGILLPYDKDRPELPPLTGTGVQEQLLYFQNSVAVIEEELARGGSSNKGFQDNVEQMETVLMGLWDIIQSGYEEIRKQKADRRLTRSNNGLSQNEDDMSEDEGGDLDEPFSLQAFSAKVQWLYSQATKLKDQKKVLQTQIKQQRELNNKSDATKDADLLQKTEELARVQALLVRTEADADHIRQQLSEAMEKLEESRQQEVLRDQERSGSESAAVRAAQEESDKRQDIIAKLEAELQDVRDGHSITGAEIQSKLSESESKITALTTELEVAAAEAVAADKTVKEKSAALEEKEKEIDEMNMELARLQTEVTIARAELDGAYGSRAQRAAEVASNPVIQREIDTLTRNNTALSDEIAALKASSASAGEGSKELEERLKTLKKELEETIEEYEIMTKASIEWEKERERLEETIDKLRNERGGLEDQLSDERVRWLGMKSPGGEVGMVPTENTSTTVLKNEFKKMMRDTRAESAKALRVCSS